MAAAVALAVDVETAAATPMTLAETPTEVLFADAMESSVAVLVIASSPSELERLVSLINSIPSALTSTILLVVTLPPSPMKNEATRIVREIKRASPLRF